MKYVTKLYSTFCMTFWVTANLQNFGYPMKFPRCNNGTTKLSHRPCWTSTKGKVMTFMDVLLLWARSYEQNLKRQSNERKNPGSPHPKKVYPTQCAVMFIVAYDIDGVILPHNVPQWQVINTAYHCTFLQHHISPVLRRKRRHLMVQNPIILHDMQGVT